MGGPTREPGQLDSFQLSSSAPSRSPMASEHVDVPPPPPYILSALLKGHLKDVRSVAHDETSGLFSVSRDSTTRQWRRSGPNEGQAGNWHEVACYNDHVGFVNSVACLPGGGLATGGQDGLIQVRGTTSLEALDAPVRTFVGHSHNVCSLHVSQDGKLLASGSWDCTARLWDLESGECLETLDHEVAAVWDVLIVEGKGSVVLITACADGLIRRWDGGKCTLIFKGHMEPVRALAKVLPEEDGDLFASCSNDGTIRLWNLAGDAITELEGHDSYIYALVSIPSICGGGLASSGEDGIVKIWNAEDGEEDQTIEVPAISAWALSAAPNGDLALGCSDDLIWVFTRDLARKADETTLKEYEAMMSSRVKSKAPAHTLPLASASELSTAGKEGEIKLVKSGDVTHAYQWSSETTSWSNLGEVVAPPAASDSINEGASVSKEEYEGGAYDYVFDIDVKDDEPALKLPFNIGDDVAETAKSFATLHHLPLSYVSQIEEFIKHAISSRQ